MLVSCAGDVELRSHFVIGDGEHLLVDDEYYDVVAKFCYLGDVMDAEGGSEAAVATNIRIDWKAFRELAPFLTSKESSLEVKGCVYSVRAKQHGLWL